MNDCASHAIKLGLITKDDIKKIVVSKYTYEEFKRNLEQCVSNGNEPEYLFSLNGRKYMIIGLKNSVTFQRFGDNEEDWTGESYFKNLDELYNTETIDGILLKRDWEKIESFDDYNLL